jgi:hypothetical protein
MVGFLNSEVMADKMEEAISKGFLLARRIKVPHTGKVLTISDVAFMHETSSGNIVFRLPSGSENFPDEFGNLWTGVVYEHCTRRWAEITEYKSKGLRDFPEGGVCWKPTAELLEYIKKRLPNGSQGSSIYPQSLENRGLAWNKGGCWLVQHTSGQPEFDISQLTPFLIPKHLKDYPLTPNECFQVKAGDEVIVDNPGDPSHGIVGIVERIYKEDHFKDLRVEFKRPLPKHPEGGDLLAVPLSKVKMVDREPNSVNNSFPSHWALKVDDANKKVLQQFLDNNNGDWSEYKKGWEVSPGCPPRYENYFHYPPPGGPMHSDLKIQKGYTEITTEQFLNNYKQYKLNSEKDEHRESETRESVKVRRSNLSIRGEQEIRADSARCPKSQIRIGSCDSSDEVGLS